MRRVLGLLAVAAAPLLAQQWPVSAPSLGPADGWRNNPRIAAGANGFFAAWSDFRFSNDVWGTRFDASGRVIDRAVHVAAGVDFAAIASDGDGYLAVLAPAVCDGVDVVLIDRDGHVGTRTHIPDVLFCPVDAAVVSNGSSYLVVYGNPATRYVLFDREGRRIRGPLSLQPLTDALAVASNGRDYMVAGFAISGPQRDAVTYAIGANGDPGIPRIVSAMTNASELALASDGAKYLLLITGSPLTTRSIATDGTPVAPPRPFSLQIFNPRLTWTGSEYLVSWTRFPSSITLMIGRIAVDGTLLASQTSTTNDSNGRESDFASAHGVTMLLRQIGSEMYAAPLAAADLAAGAIPTGELLTLSAVTQARPRMAALPEGAVMAWTETGNLRGRLLDSAGQPIGAVAEVGRYGSVAHHVAFDGTHIVVATQHTDSGLLYAQRFTTSLQPVDGQPIVVAKTNATEFALAAGGGVALFAWMNRTIDGAMLRSGSVTSFSIASDNDLNPPAATWNGSEFVVAYSSSTARLKSAVVAMRINADGSRVDGVPRVIAELDSPAVRPAIAPNGGGIFAAWSSYGFTGRIYGAPRD